MKWKQRFWTHVSVTPTCWLWTGAQQRGYGYMSIQKRLYRVHRLAYLLAYGHIPEGTQINHHCDIRNCVRPTHLWAGTQKENIHDAQAKGRWTAINQPIPTALQEQVRKDYQPLTFGYKRLARKYNLPQTTVRRILARA